MTENNVVYSTKEDSTETGNTVIKPTALKGLTPATHTSNLPKTRFVDVATYSAFELNCLIQDIFVEVKMRGESVPSIIQMADNEIMLKQHEIEFSEDLTNTEKLAQYDELTKLLNERRKAKRENVVMTRLYKLLDIHHGRINTLNQTVKLGLSENSGVNQQKTDFKQGEFRKFREKFYLGE